MLSGGTCAMPAKCLLSSCYLLQHKGKSQGTVQVVGSVMNPDGF